MISFIKYKSPLVLRIVFVLSAALIFFISAITYKHLSELNNTSKRVEHSYNVSLNLEKLFTYIKELEVARRDYILTHDSNDLQMMTVSKLKVEKTLYIIDLQTKDNAIQQKNVEVLKSLIKKKYDLVENYSRNSNEIMTDVELKMNLLASKKIIHDLKLKIYEMINYELKILKNRQLKNKDALAFTPIILYLTELVTLALITIAFIKISKDLQEIKSKNHTLAISNEISDLAEEVGNYGSWHWNLKDNEIIYSDNMYRMLGVALNSFKANDKNYNAYIHPEDKKLVEEYVDKLKVSKTALSHVYRIIKPNGEIRYRKSVGKLLNKGNENILVGTTIDITDEWNINLQIEERNRELERNNKELEAFNYVASHDLQEPLRKIQTFISRLEEKEKQNLTENGKIYLERIQSASSRMRLLIDDLLQFSRTNKTEKVLELSDLNTLLDNSLMELTQEIESNDVKIEADQLPILSVVPFQIQQLFTNLLSNAIKYRKKEVAPLILIKHSKVFSEDETRLPQKINKMFYKFEFIDNGIGFEPKYADKIFILFNRLHNKEEYVGTGIGLAICKKIVENHNGYIFANSESGKGSVFTLFLPV